MKEAIGTAKRLVDRFESMLWRSCIPEAKTDEERLEFVRSRSGQFVENVEAMSRYLLLEEFGTRKTGDFNVVAVKILFTEALATELPTMKKLAMRELCNQMECVPIAENKPVKLAKGWKVKKGG